MAIIPDGGAGRREPYETSYLDKRTYESLGFEPYCHYKDGAGRLAEAAQAPWGQVQHEKYP